MGMVGRWATLMALAVGYGSAADPVSEVDLRDDPVDGLYTRYFGATGNGSFGVPVTGGWDCDGDGRADVAMASPDATVSTEGAIRPRAGEVTLVFGDGTIGGTLNTDGFDERFLVIGGAAANEVTGAEIWIDDVDGDGLGDLLIGRQNFSPRFRPGAGALTILFGGAHLRQYAATEMLLDLADPPELIPMLHIVGASNYDRLGIWMRTGDVTGDGIADIAVGADEVDSPSEGNRGAVYLIRGGDHLRDAEDADLASFGATSLEGHVLRIDPPAGSAQHHFGATVQVAHLDGNARAEILVAATLDRAGAAMRLPGAPAGTQQAQGGAPRGRAYIVWDALIPDEEWDAGLVVSLARNQENLTWIDGTGFNIRFGEELAGGGDYDGDGAPDVFFGDFRANVNGLSSGVGFVLFDAESLRGELINLVQPPATLKWTSIFGPGVNAFSSDSAAQADFNGDGLQDLLICNPHDNPHGRFSAGSAHVLFGQEGAWPATIRLEEGELPEPGLLRIAQISGARGNAAGDLGDTIGYSVAAGDVNGDGVPDVIINEMLGNGVGTGKIDVGNLVVVAGDALLRIETPEPAEIVRITASGRQVRVRIQTRNGENYQLERSQEGETWAERGDAVTGNGAERDLVDMRPAASDTLLYRVKNRFD